MPVLQTSREINGVRYSWALKNLWEQAALIPTQDAVVAELPIWESPIWLFNRAPIFEDVMPHLQEFMECDPSKPLLLMQDFWVLDGIHRLLKARFLGQAIVPVKRFLMMPPNYSIAVDGKRA